MAVSWMTAYRALLLLAIVVGLYLCYQTAVHRDKPGAKPLFVLVTGALLYVSVKLAVSVVRGTPAVFVVTRFNPLGAGLATVGFVLLVIEYTGVEKPVSKRTAAGVVLLPAVVSALVWIDLESLWVPVGRDAGALSGYAWEMTSVAIANQLYMTLLLLAGIGLLVRWGIRSPDVFRTQVGALGLAAVAPLIGNLAFQLGYIPFNAAPVLFVVSGAFIAWAILWAGFLDLAPIGRETVLNQFDAGVFTLDGDHRVVDINERGCQLFDVDDADRIVGDHVDEAFVDHPSVRERYWTLAAGDSERESLLEFDGEYYTVEVIQLKHSPSEEAILGRSVIIRDITDQKRREQELEETKAQLEQSNEKLEQFAGVVSHDLRNPLNAAQLRLDLLQAEAADEHVEAAEESLDRMATMIDDLLQLSRAGASVENSEETPLAEVALESWETAQTGAAELALEVPNATTVVADRDRLRQVLENLFRNAADHNDSAVTVRVGMLSDQEAITDGGQRSGFFVEDDGTGIPAEERGTIFEHGYTTSSDGTGFGLSIVRDIVESHGWEIHATAGTDDGARFEIASVDTGG